MESRRPPSTLRPCSAPTPSIRASSFAATPSARLKPGGLAAALDIGDETVKTHVARVLSKLQVENRAQAIVQAVKRGLVTLEELDGG
jgi:hypothetical protein